MPLIYTKERRMDVHVGRGWCVCEREREGALIRRTVFWIWSELNEEHIPSRRNIHVIYNLYLALLMGIKQFNDELHRIDM